MVSESKTKQNMIEQTSSSSYIYEIIIKKINTKIIKKKY